MLPDTRIDAAGWARYARRILDGTPTTLRGRVVNGRVVGVLAEDRGALLDMILASLPDGAELLITINPQEMPKTRDARITVLQGVRRALPPGEGL